MKAGCPGVVGPVAAGDLGRAPSGLVGYGPRLESVARAAAAWEPPTHSTSLPISSAAAPARPQRAVHRRHRVPVQAGERALGLIGVTGGVVATLGGMQADAGTYAQVGPRGAEYDR